MYLPSESTHRGSPLVAVHVHQPLLVGARAKGSMGKKGCSPAGWSTHFRCARVFAEAAVEAGENCGFGTNK